LSRLTFEHQDFLAPWTSCPLAPAVAGVFVLRDQKTFLVFAISICNSRANGISIINAAQPT
jgi:hypothetical protein